MSWVRKNFDGVGLTQYPPGPHLDAVAAHYSGAALLCLDVSGSMFGRPLSEATRGSREFIAEAHQADYEVGLVLWHHGIEAVEDIGASARSLDRALRRAEAAGGNDFRPTLHHALRVLGERTGDRVVCVFGDGDLGRHDLECTDLVARARALGIRFVVRGLGEQATRALSSVLTPYEGSGTQIISDVGGLSDGIASMARGLRAGRSGSADV